MSIIFTYIKIYLDMGFSSTKKYYGWLFFSVQILSRIFFWYICSLESVFVRRFSIFSKCNYLLFYVWYAWPICAPSAQIIQKIDLNWCFLWFLSATLFWGIKSKSSKRTVIVLQHWVTLQPWVLFFFYMFDYK